MIEVKLAQIHLILEAKFGDKPLTRFGQISQLTFTRLKSTIKNYKKV